MNPRLDLVDKRAGNENSMYFLLGTAQTLVAQFGNPANRGPNENNPIEE
jgi:hypothetical protein